MAGEDRLPVVIAGGGVAALEAVLALRAQAGTSLPIEMVCPGDRFVYRPLAVLAPFVEMVPSTVELDRFAQEHDVLLHRDRAVSVQAQGRVVRTERGAAIGYRSLLVATGARRDPGLEGALHFTGLEDAPRLRHALEEIASGPRRTLAFVVLRRSQWVVYLYELALMSRAWLDDLGAVDADVRILTAERDPMEILGPEASELVRSLLAHAHVELRCDARVAAVEDRALVLEDATRIPADHVVAESRIRGMPLEGIPCNSEGFVRVDECCGVVGLGGVYAAGDITEGFPKHGGLAASQADSAVTRILAEGGHPVNPEPFDPALQGVLLGGELVAHLQARQANEPARPWSPPSKIVARHLGPYLHTRAAQSSDLESWRGGRIPMEIGLRQAETRGG